MRVTQRSSRPMMTRTTALLVAIALGPGTAATAMAQPPNPPVVRSTPPATPSRPLAPILDDVPDSPGPPAASTPLWRRYGFPVALGAAGVGLLGTIGFYRRHADRIDRFNDSNRSPLCVKRTDRANDAACQQLLDQANFAQTATMVSFALTGVFAAAAIVLKLTEPDDEPASVGAVTTDRARRLPAKPSGLRLACAPGLGLEAACRFTF